MEKTIDEQIKLTKDLLSAFKKFQVATAQLNKAWGKIYTDQFSKLYPFIDSFDKVAEHVNTWTEDAIHKLEVEKRYLIEVKNSSIK